MVAWTNMLVVDGRKVAGFGMHFGGKSYRTCYRLDVGGGGASEKGMNEK